MIQGFGGTKKRLEDTFKLDSNNHTVIITDSNGRSGEEISVTGTNTFAHSPHFVNGETSRNAYISIEYFKGNENWKDKFNNKISYANILTADMTATIVVYLKDFPEYSVSDLLQRQTAIVKEGENYWIYTLTDASYGESNNMGFVIYTGQNKVFENYNILDNLSGNLNVLRTHFKTDVMNRDFLGIPSKKITNRQYLLRDLNQKPNGWEQLDDEMFLDLQFFAIYVKPSEERKATIFNEGPAVYRIYLLPFLNSPSYDYRYNIIDQIDNINESYTVFDQLTKLINGEIDGDLNTGNIADIQLISSINYDPSLLITQTFTSVSGDAKYLQFIIETDEAKDSVEFHDGFIVLKKGLIYQNIDNLDIKNPNLFNIDLKTYIEERELNLHQIDAGIIDLEIGWFGNEENYIIPSNITRYCVLNNKELTLEVITDFNSKQQFNLLHDINILTPENNTLPPLSELGNKNLSYSIPFVVSPQDDFLANHQTNKIFKAMSFSLGLTGIGIAGSRNVLQDFSEYTKHKGSRILDEVGKTISKITPWLLGAGALGLQNKIDRERAPSTTEENENNTLKNTVLYSKLGLIEKQSLDLATEQYNLMLKVSGGSLLKLNSNIFQYGKKTKYQFFQIVDIKSNINLNISNEIKTQIEESFANGITFWYFTEIDDWGGYKNYDQENEFE